jgi:hypothetical protein
MDISAASALLSIVSRDIDGLLPEDIGRPATRSILYCRERQNKGMSSPKMHVLTVPCKVDFALQALW